MEKLNTNIFTQGMKILLSAHLYLISRNNLGFQMLMKIGNICSPLRKEFILLWMVYVESSTKYVLCTQTSSLNVTMCNRNYHFFYAFFKYFLSRVQIFIHWANLLRIWFYGINFWQLQGFGAGLRAAEELLLRRKEITR